MPSPALSRLQVLARHLVGWTALLALVAIGVVSIESSVSSWQNRCSEWSQLREMGMDQVAGCAAGGSWEAQVVYGGKLFRTGRQEEAETWFEAAVAGSSEAEKSSIAHTIAQNLEPEQARAGQDDVRAAERWYHRSFDLGQDMAAVRLGLLLRRIGDLDEADRWFEQAVERNGEMAYYVAINLGDRRDEPQSGNEPTLRARWLRRGAELGNHTSMSSYAHALRNGIGVERSDTEAFRWYKAAAQHPRASVWDLLTLTELYADGVGTPADRAAAVTALNSAKGKPLDDSDYTNSERMKLLELGFPRFGGRFGGLADYGWVWATCVCSFS